MKRYLLVSLIAGGAFAVQAEVFEYSVSLSGAAESPANASPGTGSGSVLYDSSLHTLSLSVSFSGLQGVTTISHIHAPTVDPFAGTAGVATTTPTFAGFPAGVSSGTYAATLDLTSATSYNAAYITAHGGLPSTAEADLAASFASGQAYWNIHTSDFPGGEIRGFLVAVPEPGTIALAGLGVGVLFLTTRRFR